MRDYLEYKSFLSSGIQPFEGAYLNWPARWCVVNRHVGQVYEAFKLYYQFSGKGLGEAVAKHEKSLNNAIISQDTIDYVIALEKQEETYNK